MFEMSARAKEYHDKVGRFIEEHIRPNEALVSAQIADGDRWQPVPKIEELKEVAKKEGLWNMFLPDSERGAGLSNFEYAPICELLGGIAWSSEVFNCSAPDTGNMEILERFGSEKVKETWLQPLLDGEIRSCFAMTEPAVASSDATNIESSIVRDGDEYVINGRKWWSSGAGDPRCKVAIFMGKTDPEGPKHAQQSMIVVPFDLPGIEIERMLSVFGYDHAPHGHAEVSYENVRVPADNILLGEGRGFEIAQARLGPGRIHHCMRTIGVAERALAMMVERAFERVAFGRRLAEFESVRQDIARSRMEIDQARLMVLNTAHLMDTIGNKEARKEIAAIKVICPEMVLRVLDRSIQVHGGQGVCQDTWLPGAWASARTLRLADGPDEVHLETVAKLETRPYFKAMKAN